MLFTKMHGIGNDFVLVDARAREHDWPALAAALCDRHFGVGADGLLLVLPSSSADYRMRMFNPDGSEAEMCGNGIRCFAKYVADERLLAAEKAELCVETLAGVQRVRVLVENGAVTAVRVAMGKPRLRPADVPVALPAKVPGPLVNHRLEVGSRGLAVTCVSMGNPHAVAFLGEPVADFPLATLGPQVEHHPFFPQRVNFEIANVEARDALRVRVWERGAGPTLACGTGACATAVAARLQGLTDEAVQVFLPGGALTVEWDGAGEVYMTGPAETVFTGKWLGSLP